MEYIVLKSAYAQPYKYIIDAKSKERVYASAESLLYRGLSNNFDLTQNIANRVKCMREQEVLKSIQQQGRDINRTLKCVCYRVFDTFGWDQYRFDVGYKWTLDTSFDSIDDAVKQEHLSMIEEAFFTMGSRENFHKFIREYAEGSIVCKKHLVALLKDMLEGISIEESWFQSYQDGNSL